MSEHESPAQRSVRGRRERQEWDERQRRMSNRETKIEPALTAEEWAYRLPMTVNEAFDRVGPAAAIAVANDILDDSDPRKITREMLTELRRSADAAEDLSLNGYERLQIDPDFARHLADALESYLPPA